MGKIAPGMRYASADGDGRTGGDFRPTVSIGDERFALKHNEVLFLVVVNVYGHTISSVRNYLQHRIGTVWFLLKSCGR